MSTVVNDIDLAIMNAYSVRLVRIAESDIQTSDWYSDVTDV
jgi:hypothetical protein